MHVPVNSLGPNPIPRSIQFAYSCVRKSRNIRRTYRCAAPDPSFNCPFRKEMRSCWIDRELGMVIADSAARENQ
jgi:hypothetical protein